MQNHPSRKTGCEAAEAPAAGEPTPSGQASPLLRPPNALTKVKTIVGVASGKGGVGKSMVTSLLAVLTRRKGLRTGILDADITGPSIPKAFGLTQKLVGNDLGILPAETKTGISVVSTALLLDDPTDPVLWRGPILGQAVTQFWTDAIWDEIDILFIDMPPGTGDVPLSVYQSIPLDGIVVITSPQQLVSDVVEKALKMAQRMDVPILGLIENMSFVSCPDCGHTIHLFGKGKTAETAERYGLPLLATLPIDPALAALCDEGRIEEYAGDALLPVADRLAQL